MLPTFIARRLQYAVFSLPLGLATVGTVGSSVAAVGQQDISPVRIEGCWTGLPVSKALVREFNRPCQNMATSFLPRDSDQMAKCLAQHKCDVGLVLHSLAPTATGREHLVGVADELFNKMLDGKDRQQPQPNILPCTRKRRGRKLANTGNGAAENVAIMLMPIGGGENVPATHRLGSLAAGEEKVLDVELTARQRGT